TTAASGSVRLRRSIARIVATSVAAASSVTSMIARSGRWEPTDRNASVTVSYSAMTVACACTSIRRSAARDPLSESMTTTFSIDTLGLRCSLPRHVAGRRLWSEKIALPERHLDDFADTGNPWCQSEFLLLLLAQLHELCRIGYGGGADGLA